jgi:SAM-dependent methyltransferase
VDPDAYREMAATEARHWWFVARRSILSSLIAGLELPPRARILEVGCGTGGNLPMLVGFGRVSALEANETARTIASAKTGARLDIRAGVCPTQIPFAGERFDLICLFDVLEHIDADVETLAALAPLLACGGWLVLTVPAYGWLWSEHDEHLHHKRRYTAPQLRAKIAAAGLRAVRISYFNTLLLPLIAVGRFKDRLVRRNTPTGTRAPREPLNRVLRAVFGSERFLLRAVNLPFGVSLLALARARSDA